MDGTAGKNFLKNYILDAQPILASILDEEIQSASVLGFVPTELLKSYKEMIAAGKGIRGALTLLTYQACNGKDLQEALKISTVMELFHSAILIQDDFMDRDNTRRGLQTVHDKFKGIGKDLGVKIPPEHYGYSVAVCLADTGFYISWKVLLNSHFAFQNILEAGKIYSKYITRLGYGQALDMTIGGNKTANETDVLNVLWIKSGEYTAMLPMLFGAALAGETNQHKLQALESYSKCFGWAFHIQDDVLSTFGDSSQTGKPVGNDIREGKNTLITIYLRQHGTQEQKDFLDYALGNEQLTTEEAEKLKQMFIDVGAKDYVLEKGLNYVAEGKKQIPNITENKELQNVLESLLVYMMERTK